MRAPLFILLALLVPRWDGQAAECLKIGVASGAVSTAAVQRIVDRIFVVAGSCAEVLVMPNNRLAALSDSGEIDGEAFKTTAYLDQHSGLISVPTPVYSYTGNLYWPRSAPEPEGPAAVVGIMLGQVWPKAAAQGRNLSVFEVRSYEQMAEMTHSGRLQGFLMAGEAFVLLRPRYDFLADYASRAVAELPLYLVLNRRNADRVPALDQAIQTLRGRGEIDRELRAEDK
jgi:hypothetical protein